MTTYAWRIYGEDEAGGRFYFLDSTDEEPTPADLESMAHRTWFIKPEHSGGVGSFARLPVLEVKRVEIGPEEHVMSYPMGDDS